MLEKCTRRPLRPNQAESVNAARRRFREGASFVSLPRWVSDFLCVLRGKINRNGEIVSALILRALTRSDEKDDASFDVAARSDHVRLGGIR
jgi:hypothetical protein